MTMTRWLAAGTSGLLMLVCLVCGANCIRPPPILRPLSKLVDLRGYVRTEPTTGGRSCQSPPKSPVMSGHLLPSRAWYATNCATPGGPQSSSWPIARCCTHDHGRRGSTQLAALATLDKPVRRGPGPLVCRLRCERHDEASCTTPEEGKATHGRGQTAAVSRSIVLSERRLAACGRSSRNPWSDHENFLDARISFAGSTGRRRAGVLGN